MPNTVTIDCYTYTRKLSGGVYTGWNTEVSTIHNSNSKIARVFGAKCSVSENSAGEMSFTILPDHPMYNKIRIRRSEILLNIKDVPVFCGYVEKIYDNFYKQRTVTCRGILNYLKDSVLRTNVYRLTSSDSLANMYNLLYSSQTGTSGSTTYSGAGWILQHNTLMGDCSFKHFTIPAYASPNLYQSKSASGSKFKTLASYITDNEYTYSAIESKLLKDSGIYLKVGLAVKNSEIVKSLHLYSGEDAVKESTTKTKTVSFGKNMLDYSMTVNGADVASLIYPFGKRQDGDFEEVQDRLSVKSVNGNKDYIENDDAVTNYGRIYTVKTWEDFTNITQASNLKAVAGEEIQNKSLRVDSFEVKAADLYSLTGDDSVTVLYDVVNIISQAHGINEKLICTKIEYDIDNPQNSRLSFGKTKKKLSSQIYNLRR